MAKRRLLIDSVHTSGSNPFEQITHVVVADPSQSRLSVGEVIRQIQSGESEFYVERPIGDEVDVIVSITPQGTKYLMTMADLNRPDTLLKLRYSSK